MTATPRKIARKLYRSSPEDLVELTGRRYRALARRRRSPAPPTVAFLRSEEYRKLMNRYTPSGGDYGRHEAELATKSYVFRNFDVDDRLGAFRWRGIQENLDVVLDVIAEHSGLVVDLGGAASPFGLGSVVVDRLPEDAYGNPVPYRSLDELPGKADAIISSHTLEHIPDLEAELERIRESLRPGGTLLVLLPSFYCERWRVGTHSHASFGDHVWTFGLSGTPDVPDDLVSYVEIDRLLEQHFRVDSIAYCGDDSIFAVCRRDEDAGGHP
jgi:SAM-dependent methyltransferase